MARMVKCRCANKDCRKSFMAAAYLREKGFGRFCSRSCSATHRARRRRAWRTPELAMLRDHSKAKTPIDIIAKELRRTPGALRFQAHIMKIPLGRTSAHLIEEIQP